MATNEEVQATFDRLEFRKRHTDDCQKKNQITAWELLSDKRKRCSCPNACKLD